MPGKLPVSTKKPVNNPKIIEKFNKELRITMAGRQSRGKLIFFRRLAFSMNVVCERVAISAKSAQVSMPEQR